MRRSCAFSSWCRPREQARRQREGATTRLESLVRHRNRVSKEGGPTIRPPSIGGNRGPPEDRARVSGGTEAHRRSVVWAEGRLTAAGFENVHYEP